MKKFAAFLMTAILSVCMCMSAFAAAKEYTISDLNMTITAPDGYYTLTRGTAEDDTLLDQLGVEYEDLMNLYESSNIYLNSLSPDFSNEIVVTMIEYDGSQKIFDFNDYTDKELLNTIEEIKKSSDASSSGITYKDCTVVKHPQAKFARINIERASGDQTIYGIQNYTIINGQAINVTAWSYNGAVSAELEKAVDGMVDSIKFTTVLKNPNAPKTSPVIFIAVAVAAVIVIAAVVVIIVVCTKSKKKKAALAMNNQYAAPQYPQNPYQQTPDQNNMQAPYAPSQPDVNAAPHTPSQPIGNPLPDNGNQENSDKNTPEM